jgi:hypothetical protein
MRDGRISVQVCISAFRAGRRSRRFNRNPEIQTRTHRTLMAKETIAVASAQNAAAEGFKLRVAAYIKRTHCHREAPWTRPARIARVSI